MGLEYKYLLQTGALQNLQSHDGRAHGPNLNPPRALIELVPESVARENMVLPIALDGETLTCAAVNAHNIHLQDKLAFMLNKKVRLVPTDLATLRAAINRHYGKTETESIDSMLCEFTDTAVDFEEDLSSPVARRRLQRLMAPAVALGRNVTEFKRGIRGMADENISEMACDEMAYGVPAPPLPPGQDPTSPIRNIDMWYFIVEDGQRALKVSRDGRMEVVVGPKRGWLGSNQLRPMKHFVAHPGEFLIVRFRDGKQEHLSGPAEVWFDPRIHLSISREDALQVAAREAVVVYSRAGESEPVARRIVNGPTLFVPAPGEWLHTFNWHGSDGGSEGVKKVAKGLVFQKLWLMPDQMYHDVSDVRTADDAVLTIRLMIFFELLDIERMLDTTHDPIGDFINAATSDVVDFTGRHSFESFKQNTSQLNDLDTYRQLMNRASQCGYRINKVVYRGYGAPDRLQAMHDQAIEARTKLQLELRNRTTIPATRGLQARRPGRSGRQTANGADERSGSGAGIEPQARRSGIAAQRSATHSDPATTSVRCGCRGRSSDTRKQSPARPPCGAQGDGRGSHRVPDPRPSRPGNRITWSEWHPRALGWYGGEWEGGMTIARGLDTGYDQIARRGPLGLDRRHRAYSARTPPLALQRLSPAEAYRENELASYPRAA